MTQKTVDFLFDFGSPNAYYAHRVIPGIEKRTGAKFVYVPVLLGGLFKLTNNRPPMVAFGDVKGKLAYEHRESERFMKRHDITQFQFNPFFPVNTLTLMRGAVAADFAGVLPQYVEAVFHHMWEAPKKMDDPAVVAEALTESGLDAKALLEAAQTHDVKKTLMDNTEAAAARGAFGSPFFFVGGEPFFGKDRLRDVEEELAGA